MNGENVMNQKGEQGGIVLTDGNSWTPSATKRFATGFTTLAATSLTSLDSNYTGADTKLTGVEIPANTFVAGAIVEITVTTGLIQLHYGE